MLVPAWTPRTAAPFPESDEPTDVADAVVAGAGGVDPALAVLVRAAAARLSPVGRERLRALTPTLADTAVDRPAGLGPSARWARERVADVAAATVMGHLLGRDAGGPHEGDAAVLDVLEHAVATHRRRHALPPVARPADEAATRAGTTPEVAAAVPSPALPATPPAGTRIPGARGPAEDAARAGGGTRRR